jgi:osmoprotectant transport system substrate-binding protein/osmoprotectant transport system permease protein
MSSLGSRFLIAVLILTVAQASLAQDNPIRVGSKKFTEAVILGEIATLQLQHAGLEAEHQRELGGTRILFNALLAGEIDVYPEYTGTIRQEILSELELPDFESLRSALSEHGIQITDPLGFNNTYAIGTTPEKAAELNIRTISDLRMHPELVYGFTSEFLNRGDGWPSLRAAYRLNPDKVSGMDHDLAYRGLASRAIDVMDLYSTDAEIAYYNLAVLEDDQHHFTTYDAVYLYRANLPDVAAEALIAFSGRFDETRIRNLNKRVKLDGESEISVAASFLSDEFGDTIQFEESTLMSRLWQTTLEHLALVGIAMLLGILVALPLGVIAWQNNATGAIILGGVGIIQTIPSLALLVFMIPLLGIAAPPAIAALFLYSLLPMVRNTHIGLSSIPPSLQESAEALGLSKRDRLLRIDLPLASPAILAGIKTSAVITIGFATLGALIGAGGYGQPILTGIRLDDYGLILEGAVPAAGLAIIAQLLFNWLERFIVPKGLRLTREG